MNLIYVLTGHYGSGKTEVAINLACTLDQPVVVDLDVVNPYFRTKDAEQMLERRGIRVIAPVYANTNVDVPSLPPDIFGALLGERDVVIDVGGDDAGAIALGQYRSYFQQRPYEMLCVVNAKRPMTQTAQDVIAMIRSVEAASRLTVTALVNNTHLKQATTALDVLEGQAVVQQVMEQTGLPLWAIAAKQDVAQQLQNEQSLPVMPLQLNLNLPWEV